MKHSTGEFVGRYAPSPTGQLHLGNLRTALVAWLQTRLEDGTFILRMDDLDQPRVKKGSAERIIHDLKWMGLDWDMGPDKSATKSSIDNTVCIQSQRTIHYQRAFQVLLDRGQLFPCRCSRKDIAQASSAPHHRDGKAVYPGTCRPSNPYFPSTTSRRKNNDLGNDPTSGVAWRFRVEPTDQAITFVDIVKNLQRQNLCQEVGDFVVKRKDGLFAYQLATVVDDGLMKVTDVVRGEDLIHSTARQIALFESLTFPVPRFWHLPLMLDDKNEPMSKRDGSQSLEDWMARNPSHRAENLIGQLAFSIGLIGRRDSLSSKELLGELTPETLRNRLTAAG